MLQLPIAELRTTALSNLEKLARVCGVFEKKRSDETDADYRERLIIDIYFYEKNCPDPEKVGFRRSTF